MSTSPSPHILHPNSLGLREFLAFLAFKQTRVCGFEPTEKEHCVNHFHKKWRQLCVHSINAQALSFRSTWWKSKMYGRPDHQTQCILWIGQQRGREVQRRGREGYAPACHGNVQFHTTVFAHQVPTLGAIKMLPKKKKKTNLPCHVSEALLPVRVPLRRKTT